MRLERCTHASGRKVKLGGSVCKYVRQGSKWFEWRYAWLLRAEYSIVPKYFTQYFTTLSKMGTVPRVHLREASALWRVVIAILFTYGALRSSWELVETCPWVPDRIGINLKRGKNRSTRRKTSRSKGENQQQTQPMTRVEARNRTRATLVDRGEWFHHCTVLANSVNWQLEERTEERQLPICSNQGCLF